MTSNYLAFRENSLEAAIIANRISAKLLLYVSRKTMKEKVTGYVCPVVTSCVAAYIRVHTHTHAHTLARARTHTHKTVNNKSTSRITPSSLAEIMTGGSQERQEYPSTCTYIPAGAHKREDESFLLSTWTNKETSVTESTLDDRSPVILARSRVRPISKSFANMHYRTDCSRR